MTKIYELAGKDRCQIFTVYCGIRVNVEFRGVVGGTGRSQYKTSDRFVQDALEHDFRFGSLYKLIHSFDETKVEEVKKAAEEAEEPRRLKNINSVKSLNDALVYFGRKGELAETDEDVKTLMDKWGVAFPNWKKESE